MFFFLSSSCNSGKPLKTVDQVDLQKYMGKWYEIATIPQKFQKGCHCVTAEYSLTDKGYVRVLNSCKKDSVDGPLKQIEGKAFVNKNNSAKLKVQFFWPFKAKYWIIDLADDYSYAVVGHPNRKYLWILSRQPSMNSKIYEEIITRLKDQNYNTDLLVKTNQNCN
jgi:apolipoprotein D and lipocalin family protein